MTADGEASTGAAARGTGTGTAAPAYLVRGDDPSLVAEATRELVAGLVGDEDPALVVEEHAAGGGGHSADASEGGAPGASGAGGTGGEPPGGGGGGPPGGGGGQGGGQDGAAAALDACATHSLLAGRRVVVLRDVGRLRAEEVNRIVAYMEDPAPTSTLVLVAGGGTLPAKLGPAVRKVGHVVDASVPAGKGRGGWLAQRLRHAPVRLDAAAVALVDSHLGSDLARLSGLLEMLASAYGQGARVGPAQVEPFLGQSGGVMPWELTDAIDRGNTETALVLLRRLLEGGQRHPLVVLAVLVRHYGAMLRLDGSGARSDAAAAEALGTKSAWTAGKALAQSRRLGSPGVARAIELLAAADLDLRGVTALPGEVVLEVLVARLSRLSRRSAAASRR